MEINTENNILSEFESQRKKDFQSNQPKDDFKIITNIANTHNMKFLEVLNIIESKKNNQPQSYNKSIISEFDIQRKNAMENNLKISDSEIVQNIANVWNRDFSEILNIIEVGKTNKNPMNFTKSFPIG